MPKTLASTAKSSMPLRWFMVLAILGIALALGLPPDPHSLAQLHISSTAYRMAVAFLLIPYIIIWYTAFYAFAKLQEYTRYVKKSAEGHAFRKLTVGMGVLAFGLVIPTLVSLIFNAIAQAHPGFKATGTVMGNYLTLLMPLIAFTFFNTAARQLVSSTKVQPQLRTIRLFVILFLILGTVYTRLTLHNHDIHPDSYYLNTFFLLVTIVIPYLYAWFLALFSAFDFRTYARRVQGLLYRRALRQFAAGITIVICGSIAIQFVSSTIAGRISRSLGSLLLVEYILVVIVAVGLVLMALGTKKLKKIEEV
jgi:membrane protease YdiL (CAAX protease family)